jgi:hypothetical protein
MAEWQLASLRLQSDLDILHRWLLLALYKSRRGAAESRFPGHILLPQNCPITEMILYLFINFYMSNIINEISFRISGFTPYNTTINPTINPVSRSKTKHSAPKSLTNPHPSLLPPIPKYLNNSLNSPTSIKIQKQKHSTVNKKQILLWGRE